MCASAGGTTTHEMGRWIGRGRRARERVFLRGVGKGGRWAARAGLFSLARPNHPPLSLLPKKRRQQKTSVNKSSRGPGGGPPALHISDGGIQCEKRGGAAVFWGGSLRKAHTRTERKTKTRCVKTGGVGAQKAHAHAHTKNGSVRGCTGRGKGWVDTKKCFFCFSLRGQQKGLPPPLPRPVWGQGAQGAALNLTIKN